MKSHLIQDVFLEKLANNILRRVGYDGPRVYVYWNRRFRTTAGVAFFLRKKRVQLHPILKEGKFRRHLMCTLKHELAHILAYSRFHWRTIKVHGPEWRRACRELGIPKEKPFHDLVFRGINVKRKFFYYCPNCKELVSRVRPFKTVPACIKCCRLHNEGKYYPKFRLRLISARSFS